MRHTFYAILENIELKPLSEQDIESLRVWRNDKDSTKFLRKTGYITKKMQQNWFEDYKTDENIYSFAIYETKELNRLVGSVSLYNFRGNVAEIGKIQIGDKEAHGKGIGRLALLLASKIGFEFFNLKQIDAVVNKNNMPSLVNFRRIGFKEYNNETNANDDIFFVIDKKDITQNNKYKDIKIVQ